MSSSFTFNRDSVEDFPAGLKVLVVDDDPVCLKIVQKMLERCRYQVATRPNGKAALDLLRGKTELFDLVLSDVYMPDMDGFKLLELIGLELGLPVIMMSSNGETGVVLRGVTHGAVDFLIKPVRIEELRIMWQHVVRKRHQSQDGVREGSEEEGVEDRIRTSGLKRKESECPSVLHRESDDGATAKKPRVVWSMEMHAQFVSAVDTLGVDKAVPKRILDLMKVEGLTRENVASHLQKYRLYLKRAAGLDPQGLKSKGSKAAPAADADSHSTAGLRPGASGSNFAPPPAVVGGGVGPPGGVLGAPGGPLLTPTPEMLQMQAQMQQMQMASLAAHGIPTPPHLLGLMASSAGTSQAAPSGILPIPPGGLGMVPSPVSPHMSLGATTPMGHSGHHPHLHTGRGRAGGLGDPPGGTPGGADSSQSQAGPKPLGSSAPNPLGHLLGGAGGLPGLGGPSFTTSLQRLGGGQAPFLGDSGSTHGGVNFFGGASFPPGLPPGAFGSAAPGPPAVKSEDFLQGLNPLPGDLGAPSFSADARQLQRVLDGIPPGSQPPGGPLLDPLAPPHLRQPFDPTLQLSPPHSSSAGDPLRDALRGVPPGESEGSLDLIPSSLPSSSEGLPPLASDDILNYFATCALPFRNPS